MTTLQKVIEENAGKNFCELPSQKQAEYLGALAERGASDALKALGLNDAEAAADIRDIRDLLRALRMMKKAAWTTSITALGRMLGWVAIIALATLFMNGKAAKEIALIAGP